MSQASPVVIASQALPASFDLIDLYINHWRLNQPPRGYNLDWRRLYKKCHDPIFAIKRDNIVIDLPKPLFEIFPVFQHWLHFGQYHIMDSYFFMIEQANFGLRSLEAWLLGEFLRCPAFQDKAMKNMFYVKYARLGSNIGTLPRMHFQCIEDNRFAYDIC